MAWGNFRGYTRKLVTPIKIGSADTISTNWLFTPSYNQIFNPPENALVTKSTFIPFANGPTGGYIYVNLFNRIPQDTAVMSGLAGTITFCIGSINTDNLGVATSPFTTVGVCYAIVHVRKGQLPSPLIPFSNLPVNYYDPQKDLLTFESALMPITIPRGTNGTTLSIATQQAVTCKFQVLTKRRLEQGDTLYLMVGSNLPQANGNTMAYTLSARMFLTTN